MKTAINLLPSSLRRSQMARRRLTQWGAVIGVVLAVGWAWHYWELREDRVLARQLEVLEREHEPMRRVVQELGQMRAKLDELESQEKVAQELERCRNALALLGVVGQAAQATGGRLRLTSLEVENFQGAGDSRKDASGVLVKGTSLDNQSVAELLTQLQNSRMFREVELVDLKQRGDSVESLRDYEIRCEF